MVDKKTVVVVEVLLGYFGDVATAESAETGDSCELTLGDLWDFARRNLIGLLLVEKDMLLLLLMLRRPVSYTHLTLPTIYSV